MILRLSLILATMVYIQAITQLEIEQNWREFLAEFSPEYQTLTEFEYRKQIFKDNLQEIENHSVEYNLGLHTYRKGINQFSDKTNEEKRQLLMGFQVPPLSSRKYIQHNRKFVDLKASDDIPEAIDWRDRGAVTPVKDQGICGSGWAFSTIGAVEGQYFLVTNKSVSFSEQELVDCSELNDGCFAGSIEVAYTELRKLGGVATTDSYPYIAKERKCKYSKGMAVVEVIGYMAIEQNEEALKKAVALRGPIAVGIRVTENFVGYKDGIFYDKDGQNSLWFQAVLAVGYGSENGTDYWIIKNSWGEGWGEHGYGKLIRNKNNNCEIATCASYPLVRAIQK